MKIFPRRLLRRVFAAGRRRSERTERGELFFAAFAQKTGADAGDRPVGRADGRRTGVGMACQFLCMALTGWDVMRRPRTEDAAARRRVNAKNGGDR